MNEKEEQATGSVTEPEAEPGAGEVGVHTESEQDNTEAAPPPEKAAPRPETARLIYSAYAEMRPAPSSKYAPMGVPGYIAMLAVTAIPAVGFVIAAVLALASKKVARRRLCAAVVILRAVLFALLAAAAAVLVLVYKVDLIGWASSLL